MAQNSLSNFGRELPKEPSCEIISKSVHRFSRRSRLKVGSCPNDDNVVQIIFLSFSVYYLNNLFSESVPAKKTAKFC